MTKVNFNKAVTEAELRRVAKLNFIEMRRVGRYNDSTITFKRVGKNQWKAAEERGSPLNSKLYRYSHEEFGKFLARSKSGYFTDNAVARELRKFEYFKHGKDRIATA